MRVYEELLGLSPVINAGGWATDYGGSLMDADVVEAMVRASKEWVDLRELLKRANARVADLCHSEAAQLTSGASAGLTLAAAACMSGTDTEKIQRLPDTTNMKNEFLLQRGQHVAYSRAVEVAGGKIVEVGGAPILVRGLGTQVRVLGCTTDQLEKAITPRTAAIVVLISYRCVGMGTLQIEEIVRIARSNGVPVILDAADELPPRENLWRFTDLGVDLVIFSGGKGIRGPSSTGFILGRKGLIEACALHSSPNREGIGRGFKVSKEDIVGLVVALQKFCEKDLQHEITNQINMANKITRKLEGLRGVSAKTIHPTETGKQCPYVRIEVDEEVVGQKAHDIFERLKSGNPSIVMFDPYSDIGMINLEVATLKDGEDEIVIERLIECLKRAPTEVG